MVWGRSRAYNQSHDGSRTRRPEKLRRAALAHGPAAMGTSQSRQQAKSRQAAGEEPGVVPDTARSGRSRPLGEVSCWTFPMPVIRPRLSLAATGSVASTAGAIAASLTMLPCLRYRRSRLSPSRPEGAAKGSLGPPEIPRLRRRRRPSAMLAQQLRLGQAQGQAGKTTSARGGARRLPEPRSSEAGATAPS